MTSTKLIYMENMGLLECNGTVEKVFDDEGKTIVLLDQTVFYPQGGGQPYDQGVIGSEKGKFRVDEVRFADSPYVEYQGTLDETDKEEFVRTLEQKANEIIQRNLSTSIKFMDKSDMHTVCHHVPAYLPEGKPARVVLYGSFGIPCGGTHVDQLLDVGEVLIRKIKSKNGTIRVSYDVNR